MSLGPAVFFSRRILGLGKGARGKKSGTLRPEDAPGRRYLRGAVAGVALSMVPLVVVLVVSDGMIQGITARYIEVGTYHLQAQPLVAKDRAALEDAASSLRSIPGLAAYPELEGYAVALSGSRTTGVMVRAVEPAFLQDPGTAAFLKASSGALKLETVNQILLGDKLATTLRVKVGDSLSLVTTRAGGEGGGASLVPKVSLFRVAGIVSAGYRDLDALWAFVSLGAGYRILEPGSSRSLIGIKIARPFGNLEPTRKNAIASLSPEWDILTWPEIESNIYKSFATTRALLLLVMALAVAVAAINVGSALVMLVLERRRDIAILKSSGVPPRLILGIFALTGLAIGGLGSLIGVGIGTLLAWRINDIIVALEALINGGSSLAAALSGKTPPEAAIRLLDPAYYLERIPVTISLGELALVALTSLLLCLLASFVPATRAARLAPLEIFRKT